VTLVGSGSGGFDELVKGFDQKSVMFGVLKVRRSACKYAWLIRGLESCPKFAIVCEQVFGVCLRSAGKQ
jgi:hypothetical protein